MEPRSWFIDELAHAGDEHLDAQYVQGYDQKAQFDPAPDLAVLTELGLGPASALIDFGAGTGEFSLAAAGVCRRVIAVDVSSAMLEAVRAVKAGLKVPSFRRSQIPQLRTDFV